MVRYSEETIHTIIESNDIVEIISQYVTLKKTGNSYKGLCPFHNEKTPSFTVSQEKQLYHCFGCNSGGNVISFLQSINNMTFLESLDYLAQRVNISLPKNQFLEDDKVYQKKIRGYEIHRELANLYYLNLKRDKDAQNYLKNRGITLNVIKDFGIGVSPNDWTFAYNYLIKQGYTIEEITDSGVIIEGKDKRYYDRFRQRIMIPILNLQNKIVGFGGRSYKEQAGPKYLNSPDTQIFSKGNELFNLSRAKTKSERKQLILVEGYMDVIALHVFGIYNAVAALGTALTAYHGKLLSRYCEEVILCFDGDEAGTKATIKAIQTLNQTQLNLRVMQLPKQEDPDSYLQKNGVEKFKNEMNNSITPTEFELKLLKQKSNLAITDGKMKYVKGAIQILKRNNNDIEQDYYIKQISKEADVSFEVLQSELRKNKKDLNHQLRENIKTKVESDPTVLVQAQLIKELINHPLEEKLQLQSKFFNVGVLRELYEKILFQIKNGELSLPVLMETLDDQKQKLLSKIVLMKDDSDKTLVEKIKTVKFNYFKNEINRMKIELKNHKPEDIKSMALIKEISLIKEEMNRMQEGNHNGSKEWFR